jgi:hypothetical protein
MVELGWPPATIAALTLEQVACLASAKPPGRRMIGSPAEFAQLAEADKKAEDAWLGS